MRPLGLSLLALLLGVAAIQAQQPGNPALPQTPPVVPVAAPNAANKLEGHLKAWEQAMTSVKNFHLDIAVTRTDAVFKKEKKYVGSVLFMKPNYFIMRLSNEADKTGADYQAYVCTGKSYYDYNGIDKTITEYKLNNPGVAPTGDTGNLILDFLSGMKAQNAQKRFEIELYKESEYYVYLDIKPLQDRDRQDFQKLRMALYGPTTGSPYFPCQVLKSNPNGDTETWFFTNPRLNIPQVNEALFVYRPVKGFRDIVAPSGPAAPPPARPGQPLPPGSNTGPAGSAPNTVRP